MLQTLTLLICVTISFTAAFAANGSDNACQGQTRQLFNGKDLTGWKHVGPEGMTVVNGEIHSHGGMGLLYWTGGKIGDCTIHVVYRMRDTNDNSGRVYPYPHRAAGTVDARQLWL